jgi:two-component sensor histidine kinase
VHTAPNLTPALSEAVFPAPGLNGRAAPANDYVRDKTAIQDLARRMVDEPEAVLPRFVELAMEIAGGVSAGLSLFEEGPDDGVFRWRHLHGTLAAFEDACTPRNFSPCGVTLDRAEPVLAVHAERAYDWIADADIVVPEVLLVPLQGRAGESLGTLWIVSDTPGHFHQGHAQSVTELATFAGIALHMIEDRQTLEVALEQQSLLAKEMNHRVKNLFAVTDGMIRATARSTETKDELAEALSGRLHALASAHSLVSRHLNELGRAPRAADVRTVLEAVLRPYENHGRGASRFDISGPEVPCGDRSINGIALTFHELATNAAKYGALSASGGRVEVRWSHDDEDVLVTWTERGGPAVLPPAKKGFGRSLVDSTVKRQLGGSVEYDWRSEGLVVTLRLGRLQITN